MRIFFATLLVVTQLVAPSLAQVTVYRQSPLQQMVLTEQAFSKLAKDANTRAAFMEYIADDGLLFRPGAVNGKKWMNEHPVPASNKRQLLAWQPSFADIAAAGDLGYTTGPWELKEDVSDEKPSGYGHFVTLWKKQPDNSWRFVVDLGVSHPLSGGPQTVWVPEFKKPRAQFRTVDVAATTRTLLDVDRAYSRESVRQGLFWKAFLRYSSMDIRLYRNGSLPLTGLAAANAVRPEKRQVSWSPIAGDVSRSGDLGYTHGTYEIADAGKVTESGSYVRIWRKERNGWRVVLDVTNPHR